MVWWSEILSKTTALKQTSLCGLNTTANDTTHVPPIIIIIIIIIHLLYQLLVKYFLWTILTTRRYILSYIISYIILYYIIFNYITLHYIILYYIILYYIILYYIILYYIIYLTATGLPPSGSNTVHIYTQTKHRTTQSTQKYTEQYNSLIRRSADRAPSLRGIPWHLSYNWGKSTDKPVREVRERQLDHLSMGLNRTSGFARVPDTRQSRKTGHNDMISQLKEVRLKAWMY